MPSIAVLGPGGVGGFVAAALARGGGGDGSGAEVEVIVVARDSTAETIAREGIAVSSVSLGDFVAHPDSRAELTGPVDFLLVATKATTLQEALERIKAVPRLVVPLLNGLDHIAVLRARFGPGTVAAGSIRIEAERPAPGRVVQTSPSVRVDLAADDPALGGALAELHDALVAAGIPAQIGVSEAQVMWMKLVRLAPLALTTSATDRPIGYVRSDPHWRAILVSAIAETVAAANADGASIDPALPLAELDAAHASLVSSMQRDLRAGRPPELEGIAGAVLRAARRHGLECPTVEQLVEQIASRAAV